MKTLRKIFFFIIISACLTATYSQEHKGHDHSKMEMKKDSKKVENIVREGIIDLKTIDKNKDGKVFQDPMDWNVIADEPGKCPLCKMTLKEVTLEVAKKNLIKHGFKVK